MNDDRKIHRTRRLLASTRRPVASTRRLAVLTGAGIWPDSGVVHFALQRPAGKVLPRIVA